MQNDVDNIYLKKSSDVMAINYDTLWIVQLSNLMPFLKPLLVSFFLCQLKLIRALGTRIPWVNQFMGELAPFWIINRAQEVVDYRRLHPKEQKRPDLLQLMIDAKVPDESDELVRVQRLAHRDPFSVLFT